MKELIKNKLEKYEYKYSEHNDILSINMGLSLYVNVEFKENGKVKVSDKLKGWNFLTGMLSMSIKASMIYQTIGLFVIIFLLPYFIISKTHSNLLIPALFLLVGMTAWIILWSFYYFIKSENMKKQIIFWIEQK